MSRKGGSTLSQNVRRCPVSVSTGTAESQPAGVAAPDAVEGMRRGPP